MFRLTNSFRTLNVSRDAFNSNPHFINSQIVRWRKPRWVPKAKSKIFKVPPRIVIPEDEKAELHRLNTTYKTHIKSVRKYLISKYSTIGLDETDPEEQNRIFEADYARCLELNNKWNEEQRILREKRVAEELEAELDFARKRIESELLKQEERLQEVEEIVRREKERSKTFITPENLESAIEHALANPVDYNFAVNLNGEKILSTQEKKGEENAQKLSIVQ